MEKESPNSTAIVLEDMKGKPLGIATYDASFDYSDQREVVIEGKPVERLKTAGIPLKVPEGPDRSIY